MIKCCFIIWMALLTAMHCQGQDPYIYTAEGKRILNRQALINNCLRSMRKYRSDTMALSVCECQINAMDGKISSKLYKTYTKGRLVDIDGLLKEAPLVGEAITACYTGSGFTQLLQAEGFEDESIKDCVEELQKNSTKKLDSSRLVSFCQCQLALVKEKKLSDKQIMALDNPNSLLFYEMMYKCGNPFETGVPAPNWHVDAAANITGPSIDTIRVLNLNGLSYLQVKTGSMVQFWLFDTGATDMLINADMEKALKKEGWLTDAQYLGTSDYEMANGTVENCRRYKTSAIQIGDFTVNNVTIAVTSKGKKIIAGKSLFNKFSHWLLSNSDNMLILHK